MKSLQNSLIIIKANQKKKQKAKNSKFIAGL